MRKMLYDLVTGYAAATGCPCEAEEGSCRALLSIEGLSVHVGLVESSGMIVLQTGVALLPGPGTEGREAFCLQLLAANNLFSNTMGFTLGVDAEQELVTLQIAWDLCQLDADSFALVVNNLFAVAADWIVRLDAWHPSASDDGGQCAASSDEALAMHFMKV